MLSIFSTAKRAVLVASTAVLALSILFVTPALAVRSAPANPAIPNAATGCNGQICMHITTPFRRAGHPGLWVTVNAWVRRGNETFEGHYDLVNPRGNRFHNPPRGDRGWNHTQNAWWRNVSSIKGKWCVVAYRLNGPNNYTVIGEPCETVNQG